MVPAHAVGSGDEHFERRIARAGAHAGERGVDAHRAGLDAATMAVGDAERQIVVGVHAALGLGLAARRA